MIKDSAKKKLDVVIVWKLDRFSRNRFDSAKYKAALKKNNVRVVSATEKISEGAEGIILESVLEGMAEYYSADLSEKVTRGMTENALKCKFTRSTKARLDELEAEENKLKQSVREEVAKQPTVTKNPQHPKALGIFAAGDSKNKMQRSGGLLLAVTIWLHGKRSFTVLFLKKTLHICLSF